MSVNTQNTRSGLYTISRVMEVVKEDMRNIGFNLHVSFYRSSHQYFLDTDVRCELCDGHFLPLFSAEAD